MGVPTCANPAIADVDDLNTLYPVAPETTAVHARFIWDEETTVAVRPVGGDGGCGVEGFIVTVNIFESDAEPDDILAVNV
jgi:hypothetical protein